ncbi:MAG: DedA family protein [Calditrichaeota bacterium]|nr:DedA family protein [Calditrichota bacterium]RQW01747.1 MAG: DedA family protein [Calditrichota bacterium]
MDRFLQELQQIDPIWSYMVLFISAFIENIFPPIPGDTVTLIGAFLTGKGILNFWGVYISTTLGSVTGFMGLYAVAYWLEESWIEKHRPRWLKATKIDKVEVWFNKYGYWVILMNRFLSGVRSVISLVAGLSKLRTFRVFLLSLFSCALWNGIIIYMGAALGRNWKEILAFLEIYNRIIIIAIIIILTGYFAYRRWKSRRVGQKNAL